MNEVKQPKKPLIYYYVIVLLVLMLFNFLAMPWILQRQVREVDYGTFISMTEEKQVGWSLNPCHSARAILPAVSGSELKARSFTTVFSGFVSTSATGAMFILNPSSFR